jgi:hypothetical protein
MVMFTLHQPKGLQSIHRRATEFMVSDTTLHQPNGLQWYDTMQGW